VIFPLMLLDFSATFLRQRARITSIFARDILLSVRPGSDCSICARVGSLTPPSA
jgi:hypothetical protein